MIGGLLKGPHGNDGQINRGIRVQIPGLWKVIDIELKPLAQQGPAMALLGKDQAPPADTVNEMSVGHDEGVSAVRIGMTDHEGGARAFAAVVKNGVDPNCVKEQSFGGRVDLHRA